MIDLRAYYFKAIKQTDYYYRFYKLIDDVNKTYNVFSGQQVSDSYSFEVFDEDDAINKFRMFCQPDSGFYTNESKCWFYLVAFFLDASGYSIVQFPNVLRRPPEDPTDFTYGEIRNRAFSLGLNDGNTIKYATRRKIVAEMEFVRRGSAVVVEEALNQRIQLISTRNARFEAMETDEKLREIANLIENLLKESGKFIQPDYSSVMFDYVDNDTVKRLRKQLQCFRHSSEEMLRERAAFNLEQKDFLIDYGVTICKVIYGLANNAE